MSTLTLHLAYINPEKYSLLKLLFALIPSSKNPWNFHFAASGMQVNLAKHMQLYIILEL